MTDNSATADEAALRQVWKSFGFERDEATKALGMGVNLRLNVAAALKTVYLSAKLYFKAKTFAYPADIASLLGVGKDLYDLVTAALDTVRERLQPAVYAVAVVLSTAEQAVTPDELRQQLQAFLEAARGHEIPWYLGIGSQHIEQAEAYLQDADGLANLLSALEKAGLAERMEGKWRPKPRHFVWRGDLQ